MTRGTDKAWNERVQTLEERVSAAEAANKEVSERLAKLEVAEDPRPNPFDKEEAESVVKRLLGIPKVDMTDDVEALLWTHALRQLGVLTGEEYKRRKKQLLAGATAIPPNPPPSGTEKDTEPSAAQEPQKGRQQ